MNDNKCENIGKYISQLHRKGNVFINRELSKYDLSVGQFMFLLDLYIKDGKNQEEISDNLKIDKGTTGSVPKICCPLFIKFLLYIFTYLF